MQEAVDALEAFKAKLHVALGSLDRSRGVETR